MERTEYGRYGNPTVAAAERKLADLDGGEAALLFSSGMAAVTVTLLSLLSAGRPRGDDRRLLPAHAPVL